jgi:hypothetical protein
MWALKVEKSWGWEAKMDTACEEVVASRAGREAENTDADELIRWLLALLHISLGKGRGGLT